MQIWNQYLFPFGFKFPRGSVDWCKDTTECYVECVGRRSQNRTNSQFQNHSSTGFDFITFPFVSFYLCTSMPYILDETNDMKRSFLFIQSWNKDCHSKTYLSMTLPKVSLACSYEQWSIDTGWAEYQQKSCPLWRHHSPDIPSLFHIVRDMSYCW